jgi:hypothetical protein
MPLETMASGRAVVSSVFPAMARSFTMERILLARHATRSIGLGDLPPAGDRAAGIPVAARRARRASAGGVGLRWIVLRGIVGALCRRRRGVSPHRSVAARAR